MPKINVKNNPIFLQFGQLFQKLVINDKNREEENKEIKKENKEIKENKENKEKMNNNLLKFEELVKINNINIEI